MLTVEENDRITRVGPGTPGGEFLRRYWQPACLASELPENDGAPVRVRLLGQDLIAFRDSEGKVGLLDAYCPHRRAPLFFGRNEECGLRCVYHGWKFDRHGDCVDMPSEPAGTTLQAKVKIAAYPVCEKGGLIWAYLGPVAEMPPEPDYEWLRAPPTHRYVSKTFENCNYLQCMEGGLDTAHSSFAHFNNMKDSNLLRRRDTAPRLEVERTDYGYSYASHRNLGADGEYIRFYHYVMPVQQMRGTVMSLTGKKNAVPKLDGHIWVPIDDVTTHVYNWMCSYDSKVPITPEFAEEWEKMTGRGKDDLIPGTFRLKQNQSNDYLIDRQVQKTQTYTGINGVNTQDFALQEGMGPICDRSKEFLGTSDRAIVTMRRLMLEGIDTVQNGRTPKGTDPKAYRHVRAYDDFVPAGQDWKKVFEKEIVAKW